MQINITSWLDSSASKCPDKIAFSDSRSELSYIELQKKAKVIASGLIKMGIMKDPVAIFMKKGVDVIAAFLGIAYSGNFYSPIDIAMPISRINKVLEILLPRAIIVEKEFEEEVKTFGYSGEILIWEDMVKGSIDENRVVEVQKKIIDTDLLYVLFTSGSTGIPKGVTITHRAVIDYIDWVTETLQISEKDSFGNQAPFYFDNSILDIYSTIKSGASCYIIPQELFAQPVPLLEYIKSKAINTIFWVPSALIVVSKVKALRNVDLGNVLKRVLFCGEVMPNKQLNIWRSYLPDVQYVNLYGPTEITDACTYYIVNRNFADEEPLPIGVAMKNTDIIVLNEENQLVKENEVGELCVRGTSLSMGYYRNFSKTREVFVQNPLNKEVPEIIYRTGDLVKYNQYGELIYISRKDFQIKHMGHRIELGEIEVAVSSIPEVNLCCCLYDNKYQKIVLFIDAELEKSYIIGRIRELIPQYMLPNKVIKMDVMPINANGKIDRVELKKYINN